MTQFTNVRGVGPGYTDSLNESTILLDTREAVLVTDRVDGVAETKIVGDLVVLVTPKGNATKASVYVNDVCVANAFPTDKAEKAGKLAVKLVKKGKTVEEIEVAVNK